MRGLKSAVPELWRLADLEIRLLANKDSSEILPADWLKLARVITDEQNDFDAFVITHGTDTMVYTGTALSYLLPYPCKPVVLTGSQRPLREIRTDARRNLINSVAISAGQWISEVSIFFDTLLLRANRAKKVHIEEYHAFDSPNFPWLAEERLKTEFRPVAQETLHRPRLAPRFDTHIQVVRVFPGSHVQLDRGARAVVLEAFGCGNLPVGGGRRSAGSVLELLRDCRKRKIPVVLTSQVQSGRLAPDIYEMGRRALDLGAISSVDMTFEAALVKCMLLAGNHASYESWPSLIAANWAGELTSVSKTAPL